MVILGLCFKYCFDCLNRWLRFNYILILINLLIYIIYVMYIGVLYLVLLIFERKLVRMGSESICGNLIGKYKWL